MKVNVLQAFLPRKRTTIPNKKSSRKWMREQNHGQWFLCNLLGLLKKEWLECPRIDKYTSCSCFWIHSGGFHQLWWINSKPTIFSSLQGFKQVGRSHDEIILTLASIGRLVVQVSGRYYLFLCETPLSLFQVMRIVKSH